jgi:hypothetical protein
VDAGCAKKIMLNPDRGALSPIQFERTMLYAFDSGAFCLQVIPPEGKML